MEALAPLLITFGLMWVLLIRPQQRRVRQHQAVVSSLAPGDEVVTAGGIHGTIVTVDGDTLRLEVAPGVVLRVLRGAVNQRLTDDEEGAGHDDGRGAAEDGSDAATDAAAADDET